jgi:Transposase DDE domain
MVYFWAVLHERPTSWACCPRNWPSDLWPRGKLPSQSTMSRRLGTTEVQRLMWVMEQYLVQLRQTGIVTVVDGKPLTVGIYSKDHDAAWGPVGNSYAKGYRLHAVYGSAPLPLAWEIAPMNVREPEVATRLIPALHGGGYVLGDKAYDSNPLHDVALATGHQLVTERKLPQTGLGHRQQSQGRLRCIALLQTEFGKALYHCRDDIERCFGWLTNHACGLSPLPSWVRREHRVRSWVQAKLIIHAIYVYLYHDLPVLAVA